MRLVCGTTSLVLLASIALRVSRLPQTLLGLATGLNREPSLALITLAVMATSAQPLTVQLDLTKRVVPWASGQLLVTLLAAVPKLTVKRATTVVKVLRQHVLKDFTVR